MQEYGMIDVNVLVNFIRLYAFETIGTFKGRKTTLCEEMGGIAEMISHADVCRISVNPYRTKLAYSIAEYSDREKFEQVRCSYDKACKKILWLNSMCATLMSERFITKHISLENLNEIENIVDEFEALIRYTSTSIK